MYSITNGYGICNVRAEILQLISKGIIVSNVEGVNYQWCYNPASMNWIISLASDYPVFIEELKSASDLSGMSINTFMSVLFRDIINIELHNNSTNAFKWMIYKDYYDILHPSDWEHIFNTLDKSMQEIHISIHKENLLIIEECDDMPIGKYTKYVTLYKQDVKAYFPIDDLKSWTVKLSKIKKYGLFKELMQAVLPSIFAYAAKGLGAKNKHLGESLHVIMKDSSEAIDELYNLLDRLNCLDTVILLARSFIAASVE